MLPSHGAIVSVTLLACICIAGFFNTGVNGAIKELKSFDPESLYEYFKDQAKSIDTANKAEVDGLAYFTPMSKQVIDDGEVYMSKRNVLDYYNSLSDQNKREIYNAQKKIKSCWDDARNHTQNLLRYYKNCPYTEPRSDKCQFFEYRQIIKGNIQLKLVSCMSQKTDGEVFDSSQIIHIKAGSGAPFQLYASKGTGVVFNLRNPTDSYAIATKCMQAVNPCYRRRWTFDWILGEAIYVDERRDDIKKPGIKCRYGNLYEESSTMSFTVSYFSDMDDLLHKNFHTVQIGVDVPGLEVGIDVLLHFSVYGTPIGFGFAFGMGFRLVPFDFATDNCYTKTFTEYKDSVHIFSNTDQLKVFWPGSPVNQLSCDLNLLGVISEETRYRHNQVCCPENNPDHKCDTIDELQHVYGKESSTHCRCNGYCWFQYRCPNTPQELYSSKGLKFIISRSSCPGQTYIAEAHYDKKKCIDLWKLDKRQKYMQYKLDSGECWFGDTNSIDFCVWAPSEASVIYHR